jgi:carboxymethylenebutenolidase
MRIGMLVRTGLAAAVVSAAAGVGAFGQATQGGAATAPVTSASGKEYGKPVTTEANKGEMITLKSADRDISAYLVTPKLQNSEEKRPAVILIHDIFGMTDFSKGLADEFAKQGYTVIMPNLYSRIEGGDKPLDAAGAAKAYGETSDQQVLSDVHATVDYLEGAGRPTEGQKIGVVGVDMGGSYAMMAAGNELRVSAAVNYYGRAIYANTSTNRPVSPVETLFNLNVPILSFYGQIDPQVPAIQVQALESRLAHNPNKVYYEVVQYPGVGHGFLNPGRAGYSAEAAKASLEKTKTFLARYLRAEPVKEDL